MAGARIALAGIVLLIASLAIFFASLFALIQDPSQTAQYIVETPDDLDIEKGEYYIWYEAYSYYGDPGDVLVCDSNGNNIFSQSSYTVSVTINDRKYYEAGSINVDNSGTYRITTEYPSILYFTSSENTSLSSTLGFVSLIAAMLGGLLLLIALMVWIIMKLKQSPRHGPSYHRSTTAQQPYKPGQVEHDPFERPRPPPPPSR